MEVHDTRLDAIDESNKHRDREIEELKDKSYSSTPTSSLKVNGIPITFSKSLLDLGRKILDIFWLSSLHSDILDARLIEHNVVTGTPSLFSSFVIKFKSRDISLHVLQAKRQHGKIFFSDIVPEGAYTEVTIFEMLPPHTFKLRRLARERGNNHDYKHVCVNNACVYARKNDSSEVITISTKADLKKIKWRCALTLIHKLGSQCWIGKLGYFIRLPLLFVFIFVSRYFAIYRSKLEIKLLLLL